LKFEGIYTPAVTPHTPDGAIDWAVFGEVLEYLIESKVHGIIIGGSTGEYYAQTAEERTQLAVYAKDVIGTRTQLIVGTGAIRTEDAVQYAKDAKSIKADAILVTTPPYALPTDQENAIHALTIDRAADMPIMLYNYPGRMCVQMNEDYLARVSKSKNVVAIKAGCTCWPASSRTSPCPAAGMTRPWNSSPGAPAAGSAPAPTSSPASMWPCTRPASWKKTSTRGGRSCRP
jgi:4-hydroxy-tetrahydrodipicolinate synthase